MKAGLPLRGLHDSNKCAARDGVGDLAHVLLIPAVADIIVAAAVEQYNPYLLPKAAGDAHGHERCRPYFSGGSIMLRQGKLRARSRSLR